VLFLYFFLHFIRKNNCFKLDFVIYYRQILFKFLKYKKLEGESLKRIEIDELQQNLDWLGLKISKLPKFIKDSTMPSFNISRLNNDKDLKVYKFVPIEDIEILLTPTLRSDDIKKKYSEAMPLKFFLNDDGDAEEIMLYKTFAKIVRNMSVQEIEKIEKIQENFMGEEPFKVRYNRDNLWQIYYSEETNKYFMLVCTKEDTFSEFLYLLKAKIEAGKKRKKDSPKIYVPINYVNYSEEILHKNEIADIENYLWLFTKNWPLVFEVYDNNNELSLQIVGETFVYKNIKSNYKIVLKSVEEAIKFYKLLKALFILQTEIKGQYSFETKIDSSNSLSMYLSKVEITFDSLTNFIKNEFLLADYEIKNQNKKTIELEKKLAELKADVKEKEDEYLQKQKEISTYLECKKTFIGKVKYFFKSEKKEKAKRNIQNIDNINEIESGKIDTKPLKTYIGEKEFYTIEDLVTIYSLHERGEKYYKNLKQDIKALELKLENLISKVRNANLYIEEIDKHKRSIFEFWKFANKDEKLALEMADDKDNEKDKNDIRKSFDLDMDFEKLGEEVDKLQRKKLSHEETDSIFVAQTELLDVMNMIRSNNIVKDELENVLENLKTEFNQDRLVIGSETFDIFGNIEENNSKVKYIGSRSHREIEKSKFKIMNINKKIDIFDFTEKMQSTVNYLEGAIPKINSLYDMSLYKLVPISKTIEENNFETYNINVEDELAEFKDDNEGAYNLICLNYKEGMPLLYYSNIMFFDNTNRTLPGGMNLSYKVLIDNKRLGFSLINKTKFRTNSYFTDKDGNLKSKDIFVYEYDVYLKDEKNQMENLNNIITTSDFAYQNANEHLDLNEEIEDDIPLYGQEQKSEELSQDYNDINQNQDSSIEMIESVTEEIIDDIVEEIPEEPVVKKSKKLLKIEQKYEKELEKQQKKEEKARRKLEKKSGKK